MGKRANLLDVMDMDEIFDEFVTGTEMRESGKMGDILFLNLKNRLLEEKVAKLEIELTSLKERLSITEKPVSGEKVNDNCS